MGPADAHEGNDVSVGCMLTCALMEQVKKFWETDFGGSFVESRADVAESVEDKRARSIMEGSVKLVDGHYKMDLPWRFSKPYLLHNKVLAEARLRILKRKLQKDEGLLVKYRDAIMITLSRTLPDWYRRMKLETKEIWDGTYLIMQSSILISQAKWE